MFHQSKLLPERYFELIHYIFIKFTSHILRATLIGCLLSLVTLVSAILAGHYFSNFDFFCQPSVILGLLLFMLGYAMIGLLHDFAIKTCCLHILSTSLIDVWQTILSLPVYLINQFSSDELLQRFNDYESALFIIVSTIINLFLYAISLLFLLSYLFYCDVMLTLVSIFVCIISVIIKIFMCRKNLIFLDYQLRKYSKLTCHVNGALLQIETIRSANIEHIILKKWLQDLISLKKQAAISLKLEAIIWLCESMLPLVLFLCCYIGIYLSANNQKSLVILQFIICLSQVIVMFDKFSLALTTLLHAKPNLVRMIPILSIPPEKTVARDIDIKGDIKLENVCYQHQVNQAYLFHQLTMQFNRGNFIGIMGKSGSGKSTIFRLILNFAKPTSGKIFIDHKNMNDINIYDIRRQFGVVLQTSRLLPGTIFSNIAMNTNLTLEEAWELASAVGLADEIQQMPMKMQTLLVDNGVNSLSAGQRQKILLARALSIKPKVLLLDEATSAMDIKSEASIYRYLLTLPITRIVIAHRHSTIADADKIYVLEQGKIIGDKAIKN